MKKRKQASKGILSQKDASARRRACDITRAWQRCRLHTRTHTEPEKKARTKRKHLRCEPKPLQARWMLQSRRTYVHTHARMPVGKRRMKKRR